MRDRIFYFWERYSDKVLAQMMGEYIVHHRKEERLSQAKLAKAANISRSTLALLEKGELVKMTTVFQVLRALDRLHVFHPFIQEEKLGYLQKESFFEDQFYRK
jgi:transcriptional regulator with XRE-family HTH domain